MIEATQLRIGNYVTHKGAAFKVTSIEKYYIGLEIGGANGPEVGIKDIDPIALNAKLFANISHHIYSSDSFEVVTESRTFIFNRHNNLCWHVNQKIDDLSNFPLTTLCFLHQFQNLVLLLTNKELEIQF